MEPKKFNKVRQLLYLIDKGHKLTLWEEQYMQRHYTDYLAELDRRDRQRIVEQSMQLTIFDTPKTINKRINKLKEITL